MVQLARHAGAIRDDSCSCRKQLPPTADLYRRSPLGLRIARDVVDCPDGNKGQVPAPFGTRYRIHIGNRATPKSDTLLITMPNLWWGFWKDYPKVQLRGIEYAQIGNRLYTEHVVTRFLPSGRRTIGNVRVANGEGGGYSFDPNARSISPNNIEHTIRFGSKLFTMEKGEARTVHTAGDLTVVTTRDEKIVITAIYSH